jgi:pimeloyl-ACP methyl ester carboxylesterase
MRRRAREKSHSVMVNGFTGRFFRDGHGPALVILSSPLIRASNYKPSIRALSRTHSVYVVEMPGSGRASRVGRAWSLKQYADWLSGFCERLHLPSAIVIGHSNSGAIAIAFALAHPEKVASLVLADSTGMLPRSGSLIRTLIARIHDSFLEPWLTLTGGPSVLYNLFWHTRNFLYQMWLSPRLDLRACLPDLRTPTLIAWGGRDHTVPREYARQLQEYIPSASYVTFQKGSHDWIIEYPVDFARILNSHLHGIGNGLEKSPERAIEKLHDTRSPHP